MKKSLITFIITLSLTGCSTIGKDWSIGDTYRQGAFTILHLVDYGTTKDALSQKGKYKELNPLVRSNLEEFTSTILIVNTIIPLLIEPKIRKKYQILLISVKVLCVGNNLNIGLKVKF
jgi:hypothetical protein